MYYGGYALTEQGMIVDRQDSDFPWLVWHLGHPLAFPAHSMLTMLC